MTNRTDNFNRADTTNGIGTPSDAGSAWIQQLGTWGISSNRGYESANAAQQNTCVLESSVSNVNIQATILLSIDSFDLGLVARAADSNNYLMFIYTEAVGLRLFKSVGGTLTQLGSTVSYTATDGDVLKFSVTAANDLIGYINGVQKISQNDSAGSTNTKHGLRTAGHAAGLFDDFSITDLSSSSIALSGSASTSVVGTETPSTTIAL